MIKPLGILHRAKAGIASILLLICTGVYAYQSAPQAQYIAYLPYVVNERDCLHLGAAGEFYGLLIADSRQQRAGLNCNRALMSAAQTRAAGLVASGLWSHQDAAGRWANDYARAAGCNLPAVYGAGNGVETLAAGAGPKALLEALGASEKHANHIFGRVDMFKAQDQIGIAFVDGSRWGPLVVVMIAECE